MSLSSLIGGVKRHAAQHDENHGTPQGSAVQWAGGKDDDAVG
jgi:hypothetical protein